MGARAYNLDDADVLAGWNSVLAAGHLDPSEVITVAGQKRVQGEAGKWEDCRLTGPRWAVANVTQRYKKSAL